MGRRHHHSATSSTQVPSSSSPRPDEAPILRDIFGLYTRDRLGTRAIATVLNERGVPDPDQPIWSGTAP